MSSETRNFIVATAGHVDHGKSALVKALTGTDPDRLPEEKARGITIDLGFAHLALPVKAGDALLAQGPLDIGIVDVPGHEHFVKNMVAGVGSIDLALLVIAADDGWMPQTEEHLQILSYLRVPRAVVALTKSDRMDDESFVEQSIRKKLRGTSFSGAPIIPTSVVTGRGLEALKAAIAAALADAPPPPDIGKPRLFVDRVFTLRGIGTVVTGALAGGTLRLGQTIAIQPSGKTARIRNIQSYDRDVALRNPGARTALNLPDVDAATGVHRGDVITCEGMDLPGETLDVILEISARARHGLQNARRVRFHHGSGTATARVAFYAGADLAPGTSALAQLRLEEPAFVFTGDRFIVRSWDEKETLAGGLVLDPRSHRKRIRDTARRSYLQRCAESPDEALPFVVAYVARTGVARHAELLRNSRFSAADVAAAVSQLAARDALVVRGQFVFCSVAWRSLHQGAAEAIDAQHRLHPEQPGIPLGDLRSALKTGPRNMLFGSPRTEVHLDEYFDALVEDLCGGASPPQFAREGNTLCRATHHAALPPRLQPAAAALRAALSAKPFDPPSRTELAPDSTTQQALRYLIDAGEVTEISTEVALLTSSVHKAMETIREFINARGPATVSDLRKALGSSRRVMVPLLERLDRDGTTVRQGDTRILRR